MHFLSGRIARFIATGGRYDTLGFDLFFRFAFVPLVVLLTICLGWAQGVSLHAQRSWPHRHIWDLFTLMTAAGYCAVWWDKWWALWKLSPVMAVALFAGLWYAIGRHYVRKWREEARARRAAREAAVAHLPPEERARALARPKVMGTRKLVLYLYAVWAAACIIGGIIAIIKNP